MKVGRFRDQITLKTNHEKINELSACLYGEVIGNISAIPNYISFGMFKKGGKYEKSIRLKSVTGVTFNVLNVKTTTPDVRAMVVTVREGVEYIVQVSIDENFKGDFLRGKVLINTDEPGQDEIEVKIFGRAFS